VQGSAHSVCAVRPRPGRADLTRQSRPRYAPRARGEPAACSRTSGSTRSAAPANDRRGLHDAVGLTRHRNRRATTVRYRPCTSATDPGAGGSVREPSRRPKRAPARRPPTDRRHARPSRAALGPARRAPRRSARASFALRRRHHASARPRARRPCTRPSAPGADRPIVMLRARRRRADPAARPHRQSVRTPRSPLARAGGAARPPVRLAGGSAGRDPPRSRNRVRRHRARAGCMQRLRVARGRADHDERELVRRRDGPAGRVAVRPVDRRRPRPAPGMSDGYHERRGPSTMGASPDDAQADLHSITDAADDIAKARALISAMCRGDRWRMCVPVQRDDSDILLTRVLDGYETALATRFVAANRD
jgi:hypothetical protein